MFTITKQTDRYELVDIYVKLGFYISANKLRQVARYREALEAIDIAKERNLPSYSEFIKQKQLQAKESVMKAVGDAEKNGLIECVPRF